MPTSWHPIRRRCYIEQIIPNHHQILSREKPNMKWSKYSMCIAEAKGTRYITTFSGKDFPRVTECGNHWNILVMHKTLSPTSITYILWLKEHPRMHKRRPRRIKNNHPPLTIMTTSTITAIELTAICWCRQLTVCGEVSNKLDKSATSEVEELYIAILHT